jgi:acetyl esterase
LCAEVTAIADVGDHVVTVEGGEITVRVYTPDGRPPFAGHLYFHGGGFWTGTVEQYDRFCRRIAKDAHCVVASVDYRLAPENPFPTAPEDGYAALRWLAANSSQLGIDPARLSIGGVSAGANLAAVVALMARDRGGPPLVFQALELPYTDMTMSSPSIDENGDGYLVTRADLELCRSYYLSDPSDARHPYASPLLAGDLSGLPPAFVTTAEFDPLRDEGEAYARRLEEAGVPTTVRRWEGQIHGSQHYDKVLPEESKEHHALLIQALRQGHEMSGSSVDREKALRLG